jgi:hypothetical protein
MMFDSLKLNKPLSENILPLDPSDKNIKYIGTLNCNDKAIKFVYDAENIYANGLPIITTGNCAWTAAQSFALTMQASFGKDFKVAKVFKV